MARMRGRGGLLWVSALGGEEAAGWAVKPQEEGDPGQLAEREVLGQRPAGVSLVNSDHSWSGSYPVTQAGEERQHCHGDQLGATCSSRSWAGRCQDSVTTLPHRALKATPAPKQPHWHIHTTQPHSATSTDHCSLLCS